MGRFFITFSRERDMSIEMVESEEDQEESWDDAYANKRTNLCSCISIASKRREGRAVEMQ